MLMALGSYTYNGSCLMSHVTDITVIIIIVLFAGHGVFFKIG
jgi:hypothetical protein